MTTDLTALRQNYGRAALTKADLPNSPVLLFDTWFNQAISNELPEPYAFTLATASCDGTPNARILLLRGFGDQGFKFYTNYESDKGVDLAHNPQAQMLFFWHALEQQVRISGTVEKLSEAESTAYFHARPFESQLGAWVSKPQSGVVANREVMEAEFARLKQEYSGKETIVDSVDKPPAWGGYILRPNRFEFWQGRPNRMHDRLVYELADKQSIKDSDTIKKSDTGQCWNILRLYP